MCLTVGLACAGGCAGRSLPEPATTGPRVSWELRAGERRGDEELVCDSGGSRSCVLDATTDTRRVLAMLRLRLYPLGGETNYVGSVTLPFVDGSSSPANEVSLAVPAEGRPVNRTMLGRVVRVPGTYTMTIALDAVVSGDPAPTRVEARVPVTVR